MKPGYLLLLLVMAMTSTPGSASDACSTRAVSTVAAVSVSDGSSFVTETHFAAPDHSVIMHLGEEDQVVAVEGPNAWAARGVKSEAGSDFHRVFALGHQYHAFLLYFEEIVGTEITETTVVFNGKERSALKASYPYGGDVFLVKGDTENQPAGIVFAFPEAPKIESTFEDWHDVDGTSLPFVAVIDDGTRQFTYRYEQLETADRPPGWFYEQVPAPAIDAVQIYRLHRNMMAAHCRGDAQAIASLTAAETVIADRGQLIEPTREDTLQQFTKVFKSLDYEHYIDLQTPQITVSDSGDLGWIAVNIKASGQEINSGKPFDSQWAWIMLVRKVEGQWLTVGNAANHN